jgi:2-polyprenyl-6-methoxyphenol hydroxylase-like FAD-dependent oxidoreductase
MTRTLAQRAAVIGGSIAGLLAARVLSEYFDEVVVFDSDEIEDGPVVHKSVPQGHHLHALLQGGLRVLSSLYPSFTDDLRQLGATRIAMGRDAVWYLPDGKAYNPTGSVRTPFDSGLEGYTASRGLLECIIRWRTAASSNIRFEYGTTVGELICHDGTVRGLRRRDSRSIECDLVVDATGRGHRARRWLTAVGFPPPDETTIGLDTAYSTANFRRPKSYSGEPLVFITGPAPHFTRRGYVITIENETLLVSLIGRFGDYPPTDKDGFLAFASQLHSDLAYRIIKDGEQLTPIAHQRFVSGGQRHYELMEQRPNGFLVIGDALCHFNPIYAQGMSAAAIQAEILRELLSDHAEQSRGLGGVAASFFSKAAEFNRTPWELAASFDFAFPQTRGIRPPGFEGRARYFTALDKLAPEDAEVLGLMTEVFHLVKPLSVLQQEPLRSRVLSSISRSK